MVSTLIETYEARLGAANARVQLAFLVLQEAHTALVMAGGNSELINKIERCVGICERKEKE